jgi:small nuclear ribonucleoprotein (snRNP)-like protein
MAVSTRTKQRLDALRGKRVVVFLHNKTALRGILDDFDRQSIFLVDAEKKTTVVTRKHVTTIKEGDQQ